MQACLPCVEGQAAPQSNNSSGSLAAKEVAPAPPGAPPTATGRVSDIWILGSRSVISGAVTLAIGGSWAITGSGISSTVSGGAASLPAFDASALANHEDRSSPRLRASQIGRAHACTP